MSLIVRLVCQLVIYRLKVYCYIHVCFQLIHLDLVIAARLATGCSTLWIRNCLSI